MGPEPTWTLETKINHTDTDRHSCGRQRMEKYIQTKKIDMMEVSPGPDSTAKPVTGLLLTCAF